MKKEKKEQTQEQTNASNQAQGQNSGGTQGNNSDAAAQGQTQSVEIPDGVDAVAENEYELPDAPEQWDYAKMQAELKADADKERKADEKKRRRSALFSAIGDGISALSNLYFTTQYAPNAYDGKGMLSEKNKARWDKIEQEREARLAAYQKAVLDRADAGYKQRYTEWRDQVKDVYEEAKQRRADAKAVRDAALAELNALKIAGQITGQEYANEKAKVEADYAEEHMKSEIAKNNRTGTGGGGRRSGGGGRRKEFAAKDKNGTVHYFYTKAAADTFAKQNGTYEPTQTNYNSSGGRTTTGGYPSLDGDNTGGGNNGGGNGGSKKRAFR